MAHPALAARTATAPDSQENSIHREPREPRERNPVLQELTETTEKFSANSAASCKDKLFESLSTTKYAKHTKRKSVFHRANEKTGLAVLNPFA